MIRIASRRISLPLFVLSLLVLAAGLAGARLSLAGILIARSPDGSLAPETAQFLERIPWVAILVGAMVLLASVSHGVRQAFTGAWREPPAGVRPSLHVAMLALATGLARLAVASISDIGLGDDGARVVWLERWWRDPAPIWNGFWAPGHLYVHALFKLLTGDAIRGGVLLSAVSAAGTAWILGRHAESHWGRVAGVLTVLFVALTAVGSAYGAVPDVNPFFAFAAVAGIAAARRATVTRQTRWLWLAWLAIAVAEWSRFEGFVLAPAAGLALWPQKRRALLFALACLVPFSVWLLADWLTTGQAARVVGAVQQDPGLRGPKTSQLFSFLGAVWQGVGLPLGVAAVGGIARAWRAGTGRIWSVPLLVHAGTLAAAMVTSGTGTQPRYWIFTGALAAVYAAAAIAGVWRRSRPVGATLAVAMLAFAATLPALFPSEGFLWACRDPQRRAVVDAVHRQAGNGAVLWISDRGAYHYACRTRIPIERYAALGRADDSPEAALAALASADTVTACVEWTARPQAQWERVRVAWRGEIEPLQDYDGFRSFRMLPLRAASFLEPPGSCSDAWPYGLIDGRKGSPRNRFVASGAIDRSLESLPLRTDT